MPSNVATTRPPAATSLFTGLGRSASPLCSTPPKDTPCDQSNSVKGSTRRIANTQNRERKADQRSGYPEQERETDDVQESPHLAPPNVILKLRPSFTSSAATSGREQIRAGASIAGQWRRRDLRHAEAAFPVLDLGSDGRRVALPLLERVAARRPDEQQVSASSVPIHGADPSDGLPRAAARRESSTLVGTEPPT